MNATDIKVRSIIERVLEVPPYKVASEARFTEDLKADSLALVELVLALEDEFGIEISDEDADAIKTVGQAVQYVQGKI